jgi:tRNA threonylcarbamoyladenosine biosynthesis protein TsaE
MTGSRTWQGIDESALVDLSRALADHVGGGGVILLEGDLGAGKTTFARALLAALGVGERIKSPTYSLIESYALTDLRVHHLDLYRIADAEELEWLGLPDLLESTSLLLVEWPERGKGALPPADLIIRLDHAGDVRDVETTAVSAKGQEWLQHLGQSLAPT